MSQARVSTVTVFELFVARRYLTAKRKQALVSVITVISIAGVAAGVMALIIALAINNGFRQTLQGLLLGATAHVSVLEKQPGEGIQNWRELSAKLRGVAGVTQVAPVVYGSVFYSGPMQSSGGILKGIPDGATEGITMGSKLARATGMMPGARITVISPQGELTPFGPRPSYFPMRVAGTFETGFYELDAQWATTSLANAQKVLSTGDVVNSIELKVSDIQQAPQIATAAQALLPKELAATHWMEQNRPLLSALKTERVVTTLTISLIELIAALNILITLTMMVMEKNRDIAILVSMGATVRQIRRIFMAQGILIGVVGTAIGLVLGYLLCYLAGNGHWITLDEQVYALGYLPFEPRWVDGVWVSLAAIGVSFVATLYPAYNAARVAPAEALRYE